MIGIITLPNAMYYNYGGVLQNYALMRYLNKNNMTAKAIHCDANTFVTALSAGLFNKTGVRFDISRKSIRVSKCDKADKIRNKQFRDFINNQINPIRYSHFSGAMCDDIKKRFDFIITGSDQVWNPVFNMNSRIAGKYFLSFVPYDRRISYAASFGTTDIPKNLEEIYINSLKGINHISVREQSGAELVKKLSGRDAEISIDPTLLLDSEEWGCVLKKAKGRNSNKYILKYFLGEESKESRERIGRIADKYKLEIYDITDKKNQDIYSSGPGEFLDLISNADLVCTDSFHATVFSIIFGRPFLIMRRTQDKLGNMWSRITTLLKTFNLEHRLPENITEENIFECDYSQAYEILKEERNKTRKFFMEAIKL